MDSLKRVSRPMRRAIRTVWGRIALRRRFDVFRNRTNLRDPACMICNFCSEVFVVRKKIHPEGMLCPHCGAIGREHMLYYGLMLEISRKHGPTGLPIVVGNPFLQSRRILEISPRVNPNRRRHYQSAFAQYTAGDFALSDHKGDVFLDLTDASTLEKIGLFDIILCAHVLEHIPDYKLALQNLKRLLTPGGFVIFQVPIVEAGYRKVTWDEFHGDSTRVYHRFGFDLAAVLLEVFPSVTLVLAERMQLAAFSEVADAKYQCLKQYSDLEVVETGAAVAKLYGFGPAEMADVFILRGAAAKS